jgi:hypothetical protein
MSREEINQAVFVEKAKKKIIKTMIIKKKKI